MIARLLLSPDKERIKEEIQKTLASHIECGNVKHPDILFFPAGEKLGIAEARKIKEHFSLKPFSAKGRAAVLEDASILTPEAQNALLKTIEELTRDALLILGASSDANFLPTVLSRCEIVRLETTGLAGGEPTTYEVYIKEIEKLLDSSFENRFEYVEKIKNKEEFLHCLVYFFRQEMLKNAYKKPDVLQFLKELLPAEQWAKQNVNIRAILEYLMLVMPKLESRV
ncbi:MAG: hypothetical protein ACD_38C00035G0002 [uncultured bacterium]|uniref:Polymerase III, delta prime subunit protein n=1 Tax=Candidatus Daviesbacteria bacterium GW2011_GWC2_40_12 TaxID=1618431 RepID=A0A0G0QLL3_9BACT|nr:MAG: hypothetical protein ACD_38C00035G0002 [uncultured bacterium]KKR24600.1 MAG: hypothetical protein UT54_C0016G0002 [Candidatus Daviesbacteria bacterium GW2011_GWB1_39_5]KKR41319.1 MAG: hypothetical protein UT77_C0014G0016 [Candidatus Daviesbacteria bacterium GW2011_GWC2_40_12]OGE29137.1 MAG: hypothetical protein A3C29_04870 [Candidatus Daviesbacteria bacterium RIFCSPHIGHO2_02_FULL_40_16]OGE43092.1 MAG: hypothetical protein A3A53_00875 [Candidatus Daviesbacteria bacterium RIFCSPLOWO2_01_F